MCLKHSLKYNLLDLNVKMGFLIYIAHGCRKSSGGHAVLARGVSTIGLIRRPSI